MEMPKYLIHRRLKVGKHYPPELPALTSLFEGGIAIFPFALPGQSRKVKNVMRLEIQLIEKTFLDFFLNRSNLIKYELKFDEWKKKHSTNQNPKAAIRKELQRLSKAAKIESGPCSIKVVNRCVDRINRKLKFFNPRIQSGSEGYKLNFTPYFTSENSKVFLKKPSLLPVIGWAWLAKVIDGLDPKLFHQCGYCQKIFFSKQIKKFHTECRSKYFSEKAVESGFAKKWQKDYRRRLKKKTKAR